MSKAAKKYVYYINVGHMPKAMAKLYLKEVRKAWRKSKVVPKDSTLFVPIREGDGVTRIEVLP